MGVLLVVRAGSYFVDLKHLIQLFVSCLDYFVTVMDECQSMVMDTCIQKITQHTLQSDCQKH